MVGAKIEGMRELEAKFKKLDAGIKGRIGSSAVDKGAEFIQEKAHDRCAVKGEPSADGFWPATDVWYVDPTRAGAVRRSIKRITDGLTAAIGTNHMLAPQLEFGGTKGESARPFMRSALDENKNEIISMVGKELWQQIEGAL